MKEIIFFAVLVGLGVLLFARYVLRVKLSSRDGGLIALGGLVLFGFAVVHQTPEVVFDSTKGNYLDKKLILVSVATVVYGSVSSVLGLSAEGKTNK